MNRNETFPALSVSTLAIHLAWASLEIIVSDVEDIQLMVSGEDTFVSELKLALTDGCLAVEQPSYGLSMKLKNERWMQVLLRLPRSWKGGVTAGTASGRLSVRGLTGTDITLGTVSGSLHAEGLTGINLALHTVSGAILASDLAGDALSLRTVSGGVKLSGCGFGSYRLSGVSSDMDIGMVSPFDLLEGSTVSGDIRVTAPINRADASLRAVSGRLYTEGISIAPDAPRVALSSVSANVQLISSL